MTNGSIIGCEARELYIDGELTALESAAFDRHMAACPACRREIDRALRLRADLRAGLTRFAAGDDLRDRIRAALPGQTSRSSGQSRSSRRDWLSMAVAASVAAILAGGATLYAVRPAPRDSWEDAVLKSHLRATMSGHGFDVASSDRHTVKPWFSGKTAVAPMVVDLAAAGFPLLGGRLDIPEKDPLPVLVYQAGPHVISLFVRPGGVAGQAAAPAEIRQKNGFSILAWRERGQDFTAVSDADVAELNAFQRAFSAGLALMP